MTWINFSKTYHVKCYRTFTSFFALSSFIFCPNIWFCSGTSWKTANKQKTAYPLFESFSPSSAAVSHITLPIFLGKSVVENDDGGEIVGEYSVPGNVVLHAEESLYFFARPRRFIDTEVQMRYRQDSSRTSVVQRRKKGRRPEGKWITSILLELFGGVFYNTSHQCC